MSSKECGALSPEKSNIQRACVLVRDILNNDNINDICDALQSRLI